MKALMGMGLGRHYCAVPEGNAEAGDGGVSSGGGASIKDGVSSSGEGGVEATPSADPAPNPDPKPYLGDGSAPEGEGGVGPSKPASEDEYLKAVVKDEVLLGSDKNVQLDNDLVKAMIPEAQRLGVSPETMGKLANALAKAQIDKGRQAVQQRVDYFNKMKAESVKKYTPQDFAKINAGIDHWFKPGGVMNSVIRSSELGADPEFLALMHFLGSRRDTDSLSGVGDGGGGSSVDPNGIDGLAKMW